ncbi:hypothetical protein NL676_010623 [Syzygium grande]|nr:hypothetical protein NL676_010623 [Syzygium grande]
MGSNIDSPVPPLVGWDEPSPVGEPSSTYTSWRQRCNTWSKRQVLLNGSCIRSSLGHRPIPRGQSGRMTLVEGDLRLGVDLCEELSMLACQGARFRTTSKEGNCGVGWGTFLSMKSKILVPRRLDRGQVLRRFRPKGLTGIAGNLLLDSNPRGVNPTPPNLIPDSEQGLISPDLPVEANAVFEPSCSIPWGRIFCLD